jgi:hypothetical protein
MVDKEIDIEQMKLEAVARYSGLKEVADLLAACPHVIPANIGVAQYLEELRNGSRLLAGFLIIGPDHKFVS